VTLDATVSHACHQSCAVDMVCVVVWITAHVLLDGTGPDARCRSVMGSLGRVRATIHTVRVSAQTSVTASAVTTTGLNARCRYVVESS
jgi:hypothetical protein